MVSVTKQSIIFAIINFSYITYVVSHGAMVLPNSWFDDNNYGMKSGFMCRSSCDISAKELCPEKPEGCGYSGGGCACMWYKNNTFIEKPTLFDLNLRTYPHNKNQKRLLHHPWRAPGFAPIDSPCGVAGGNLKGCEGGCSHNKGGFAYGPKAEDFHFKHKPIVTNWTRGDVVEVAWGITANHGGGYSYRLCKVPKEGVSGLTEECFQQTHLAFVGDKQWVQYGEDVSTRVEIPATRVSIGTFPEGSEWTKNPIPACNGNLGGFYNPTAECPKGTQFKPPKPDLYGFGVSRFRTVKPFQFSIVDKVQIPKHLVPGDYVISFRWDTEQTPQVWNTCASISLE